MSKLLIDEPPLLVLPSLVNEVGLPAAILLQQVHFAGRRQIDGWVERTVGDWHRALRGCLSKRTIERALSTLRDLGWVEHEAQPGGATRYRVGPAKLADVSATSGEVGPPNAGGSVSREGTTEREKKSSTSKKPVKHADEVAGFEEWLGHHVTVAASFGLSMSVPKPETLARTDLHRRFSALHLLEGYALEELELASEGVLSSEWHRAEGHTKLATVLRQPEKLQDRIDAGRAWRASKGSRPADKYGHLDG